MYRSSNFVPFPSVKTWKTHPQNQDTLSKLQKFYVLLRDSYTMTLAVVAVRTAKCNEALLLSWCILSHTSLPGAAHDIPQLASQKQNFECKEPRLFQLQGTIAQCRVSRKHLADFQLFVGGPLQFFSLLWVSSFYCNT